MEESTIKATFSSFGVITLLLCSLGYFVYNGIPGFLAILVLTICLSLSLFLSLLPFIGFLLHVALSHLVIIPAVFEITGIHSTPLTTFVFVLSVLTGLLVTLVSTAIFMDR